MTKSIVLNFSLFLGKMFDIPVKGTHAHAYVTSFSGADDVKDTRLKHRTDQTIVESDFYNKCIEWRKNVATHLNLLETEANNGELAAFASYAIAFPEGFLALVSIKYNFCYFNSILKFNKRFGHLCFKYNIFLFFSG